MTSYLFRFDNAPDPQRVASIKEALAGFQRASGIAFRLDTGHREIESHGELVKVIKDVHVEGRHDAEYLRGYPILESATLPDGLWQNSLFDRLQDSATYGKRGNRCFMPGFGVSLTADSLSLDLLFCLSCRYLYAFRSQDPVTIPLGDTASMFDIYYSLFPNQRDSTDA